MPESQSWRTIRTSSRHQNEWGLSNPHPTVTHPIASKHGREAKHLEPAVVDAVLEQETITVASAKDARHGMAMAADLSEKTDAASAQTDLAATLSTQLAMLEVQRDQLQQMLNKVMDPL